MYVLSGKGSVAGVDLAACILAECQSRGVLWDSDLPEYTLDFATQVPSVSKSIREGRADEMVKTLNTRLQHAEQVHAEYMLLCLTAHRLIPQLHTSMQCINLWDYANRILGPVKGPIAFLGTLESLPNDDTRFAVLPDQVECMGDLITATKRGYAHLGENYAAHPRHLLQSIVERFRAMGISRFFLASADLHTCKRELVALGVDADDIFDVVEMAATAIIDHAGRSYTPAFLDAASDARMQMRYKYLTHSDSPQTEKKTRYLEELVATLPPVGASRARILDIGGSSTGHSLHLARQLAGRQSEITLLDISAASLEAARPLYANADGVTTTFVNESIETFGSTQDYDAVLCLGVLLCLSDNVAFAAAVHKIAGLMKRGAVLLTRDCLTTELRKIYMAFGGVIRNRAMYDRIFTDAGMACTARNEFVIEQPIRRAIVTTVWTKGA